MDAPQADATSDCLLLNLCFHQRHSVDQCSTEPSRVRSDRATPPRIKATPRTPSLGKLNLRGASETSVKFLLQRKHQKGETLSKQGQYSEVFHFTGHVPRTYTVVCRATLSCYPFSFSVFIQWQDVLSWRHVASSFGEGPGMHPLHLYRRPPGLQTHHVSRPVSMQASHKTSREMLQDLSR